MKLVKKKFKIIYTLCLYNQGILNNKIFEIEKKGMFKYFKQKNNKNRNLKKIKEKKLVKRYEIENNIYIIMCITTTNKKT